MRDNLLSDSLCHKRKLGVRFLPLYLVHSCALPDLTAEDEAVSYIYSSNCTNADTFGLVMGQKKANDYLPHNQPVVSTPVGFPGHTSHFHK